MQNCINFIIGDASSIEESTGFVYESVELVKGVSSGNRFQLEFENSSTPLFNIQDTIDNVKSYLGF
jgi:hypothetical protein